MTAPRQMKPGDEVPVVASTGPRTWNERISLLRQWLNEDRITDPKKMVTNEQILMWLGDDTPPGVSQWMATGKKFSYWEYFEKEVKSGIL